MPTEENIAFNEMVFRCLREGAGDKVDLIHGGHGQCSAEAPIATCKPLEPMTFSGSKNRRCPPASMDEMAKVAAGTTIPVATGENLQGLEDFSRLIDKAAPRRYSISRRRRRSDRSPQDRHPGRDKRHPACAKHFFSYGPLNGWQWPTSAWPYPRVDSRSEYLARKSVRPQRSQQESVFQRTDQNRRLLLSSLPVNQDWVMNTMRSSS